MAAFGEEDCMTSSLYDTTQGSQSLKRVEPSVLKFTKIVVPTDLERLRQHKVNIVKFHKQRNWEKLTTEQINARQTVQQLKANIREMEKTRSLIREEDLPSFDSRVSPVKEEAIHAVVDFLEMTDTEQAPLGGAQTRNFVSQGDSMLRHRNFGSSDEFEVINAQETIPEDTHQAESERQLECLMQQQADAQSKASLEAWENLHNDLISLNSVIHEFATHVRVQGEIVDSIEDHVDKSQDHVSTGRRYLIKASTLKAALFPVSGAIIGGCLGGPVGLYAGMKVGTVAALGGGALGYASGRFLKKKKDRQASLELEEMREQTAESRRRTSSDPGLNNEVKKTR
ncbi:syntaxin-17-like [Asterias amurensis]|uniref:syntaxin-17-like n=1 Tax=Asterias amurensis TaxID=7602 RepID=UPI003AB4D1CA